MRCSVARARQAGQGQAGGAGSCARLQGALGRDVAPHQHSKRGRGVLPSLFLLSQVSNLAKFCDEFLSEVLQPSTCMQLLAQAMHFRMEEVVQRALRFSETW